MVWETFRFRPRYPKSREASTGTVSTYELQNSNNPPLKKFHTLGDLVSIQV
jgi:hypothetical protein